MGSWEIVNSIVQVVPLLHGLNSQGRGSDIRKKLSTL